MCALGNIFAALRLRSEDLLVVFVSAVSRLGARGTKVGGSHSSGELLM